MATKDKKEELKVVVPSPNNFTLSKVKLLKDGGIDVIYDVTENVGDQSYITKFHVESAKDIHPDLRRCFDNLRPIMGRIFNITSFKSMIATPDFKANKKQSDIAEAFAEEVLKNIEVRGVSLSGQDDNVGVVLTGLFTVANNQKTCINSPRLKFNTESFGFEEDLEEIANDIETEVYEFLFKGKAAQLELPLWGDNAEGNANEQGTIFPEVIDPATEAEETEGDEDGGI